ncbi:MAG: carboxylating nicotinate-nucleotide diphosphorylase [Cyclobacteriaceae bacterium]
MNLPYLSEQSISDFIETALNEDIGVGDHSSLGSIPKGKESQARLLIKGEGVLAGVQLAEKIFRKVDPYLEVNLLLKDGDQVKYGDIGLTVIGSTTSILSSERLVLNCMQRMSGIATKTARLNKMIEHTNAKLLDTRKTTPNFRMMEKWAVAIGGGTNHRFGLFDMVMLKDNHNDFAGGITKAVTSTVEYLRLNNLDLKIEVETRNLDEVKEALSTGAVDQIMLDNFEVPAMKEAVEFIDGRVKTEASGGITEETIVAIAKTGVDYISVGALTHSYNSLDISLKAF